MSESYGGPLIPATVKEELIELYPQLLFKILILFEIRLK